MKKLNKLAFIVCCLLSGYCFPQEVMRATALNSAAVKMDVPVVVLAQKDITDEGLVKRPSYSWMLEGFKTKDEKDAFLEKFKSNPVVENASIIENNGKNMLVFSVKDVPCRELLQAFAASGVEYMKSESSEISRKINR